MLLEHQLATLRIANQDIVRDIEENDTVAGALGVHSGTSLFRTSRQGSQGAPGRGAASIPRRGGGPERVHRYRTAYTLYVRSWRRRALKGRTSASSFYLTTSRTSRLTGLTINQVLKIC